MESLPKADPLMAEKLVGQKPFALDPKLYSTPIVSLFVIVLRSQGLSNPSLIPNPLSLFPQKSNSLQLLW
jgi:hypothetical protein